MGVVTFHKCLPTAPDVARANTSACGTIPTAAFQYCEAMRVASAFGWYVFPPEDIHLFYDGKETFFYREDQWFPIKSTNFGGDFEDHWAKIAPPDLKDRCPPFLTEVFVPGVVQVWSGYFIQTDTNWSTLIRPVANFDVRSSFSCYEGLVETDTFFPLPLFVNLRLCKTGSEIFIPADKPLFQVQPILRDCYETGLQDADVQEMSARNQENFPWDRYLSTVRDKDNPEGTPGRYAKQTRRRTKA